MPANQGRRLHDHQSASPIEHPRQQRQADAAGGIDTPRPHAALDVERELTTQEEVLGADSYGRTQEQYHPTEDVLNQAECDPREGDHPFIVPQPECGAH
jgi:hypothetical protein